MDTAHLICVDTMDMDITDMDTVILKVTPTGLIEVDLDSIHIITMTDITIMGMRIIKTKIM